MSKFTTEVRFICEAEAGYTDSAGFDHIDEILTLSAPKIFSFKFPIFDEDYRLPLEKKILKHYYTREICEETYGLWKLRLDDRMNMLMPYVNKLYESALLEFNPFHDVDLTRKLDIENNGNNTSTTTDTLERSTEGEHSNTGTLDSDTTSTRNLRGTLDSETSGTNEVTGTSTDSTETSSTHTANGSTWDLYSDTPQGGIRGIQGAENDPALGTDAYLTNARHIIDGSTPTTSSESDSSGTSTSSGESSGTRNDVSTQTGTTGGTRDDTTTDTGSYSTTVNDERNGTKHDLINNVEDYLERVTGKTAGMSYSKMLMDFRETFLNIDKILIDSLDDLFFGLWDWGNV